MNHKCEVLAMKNYSLSHLYVCKIFEVKTKRQIGVRILYRISFFESTFIDPSTLEIFYNNIHDSNVIQNNFYCKICNTIDSTIKSPRYEKMFKKSYLIKEEIEELNEIISETYFQIRRVRYDVI